MPVQRKERRRRIKKWSCGMEWNGRQFWLLPWFPCEIFRSHFPVAPWALWIATCCTDWNRGCKVTENHGSPTILEKCLDVTWSVSTEHESYQRDSRYVGFFRRTRNNTPTITCFPPEIDEDFRVDHGAVRKNLARKFLGACEGQENKGLFVPHWSGS